MDFTDSARSDINFAYINAATAFLYSLFSATTSAVTVA